MYDNLAHLGSLTEQIEDLLFAAYRFEDEYRPWLDSVDPHWEMSARNLVHYLALRAQDIRPLQQSLGHLGLSRLGRAESHVMASLLAVRAALLSLKGRPLPVDEPPFPIQKGRELIDTHAEALLGPRRSSSRSRVMVTMPSDADQQSSWLEELVSAGMSAVRINCAKDGPEVWQRIIAEARLAAAANSQEVKICMDLAGPKLRTGPMAGQSSVIKVKPRSVPSHDTRTLPARIWLAPSPNPTVDYETHLPVESAWVQQFERGDTIGVEDERRRQIQLRVEYRSQEGMLALSDLPLEVSTGTKLRAMNRPLSYPETKVLPLPEVPPFLRLKPGDRLRLTREPIPGRPAQLDSEGQVLAPAQISCTLPEIFTQVAAGEAILFNDGKIEGLIRKANADELDVEITFAKQKGSKLRPDKGINLPHSQLKVRGLTQKDREDLAFVAANADVVSMSFVNGPEDVHDLLEELDRLDAQHLGIILKIETRQGFQQLPWSLLAAMRTYPVGVMIARGDLAVEVGWQELALVQAEIGRICEAAHVPTIWATQVLETLAKKGRPSRAEITDAATARHAECVMLNKGPHILSAVRMLGTILQQMGDFHAKTAPMLPQLMVGERGSS